MPKELTTQQKDEFKYDYYEIYCEPTEIDWSNKDFDWEDFDFSNDNFSLMLRVKKGQDKPTEQEVEEFLGDDYLLIDMGNGKSKRYHVIGVWERERDDGGEVFDLDDFEYDDIITYPEVLTASLKKEDLDLQPVDEYDDDICEYFTLYLEDEGIPAHIVKASGHDMYENIEDNSTYLICDYDTAESYCRGSLENLVDDVGPCEAFGYGNVEYYLSDSYFDEMLEDDCRWRVDDMSDDEIIEELENRGIIDEDDMIPDPDWEPDEDEGETEEDRPMIYPESLADDYREELIDAMVNDYSSSLEWFEEMYSDREMEEYIRDNPDCVDIDRLIDSMMSDVNFADELAWYDNEEIEFEVEHEDGTSDTMYAYRRS